MLILSGILVMVIGLMLRFNALLVVVAAGFVTGLAGGLSINDIVGAIGEAFVKNRYMSLFILILPVIGLMERHGLRERAEILISKINAATAGRIFMIYLFVRQVTVAFGINMSGMVAMVRPLIAPMSEVAVSQGRPVSQRTLDKVRGVAASADNIGNFFGQNLFMANSGILLIVGTLDSLGMTVDPMALTKAAIPVAIIAFVLCVGKNILLDRQLSRKYNSKNNDLGGNK